MSVLLCCTEVCFHSGKLPFGGVRPACVTGTGRAAQRAGSTPTGLWPVSTSQKATGLWKEVAERGTALLSAFFYFEASLAAAGA